MKHLSSLTLASILLCMMLAACAPSGKSPGAANGAGIPVPSMWSDTYTGIFLDFTEDGTLHYIQNGAEVWLPCEIRDDRFIVSYDAANREEITYVLDGDTMTVTWTDGAETTLTRQRAGQSSAPNEQTTPESTAQGTGQMAKADASVVFYEETTTETVLAQDIDRSSGHFQMVADMHGVIHAVFFDAKGNLMHRWRDGNTWSAAEVIFPGKSPEESFSKYAVESFHATLTPEGEPCVVVYNGWEQSLDIANKDNGVWTTSALQKWDMSGPLITYDFNNPFFAFDKQGTALFLYQLDFKNYYLNGVQLTELVYKEFMDPHQNKKIDRGIHKGIMPGLGKDIVNPVFTVSPDGTFHLDYFSFEQYSSVSGMNQYKYSYSTSTDSGKTWNGPFEVCGEFNQFPERSIIYDTDGTKYISLYDSYNASLEKPLLTISAITPGGKMTLQRHFDFSGKKQVIGGDPRYNMLYIYKPDITELAAVRDKALYFYGNIYPDPSHCFVLNTDGVWHITRIIRPDKHAIYFDYGMLVLEDGEIVIYSNNAPQNTFAVYSFRR